MPQSGDGRIAEGRDPPRRNCSLPTPLLILSIVEPNQSNFSDRSCRCACPRSLATTSILKGSRRSDRSFVLRTKQVSYPNEFSALFVLTLPAMDTGAQDCPGNSFAAREVMNLLFFAVETMSRRTLDRRALNFTQWHLTAETQVQPCLRRTPKYRTTRSPTPDVLRSFRSRLRPAPVRAREMCP